MVSKFATVAVLLVAAVGLLAANGVVSSTKNPLQVALLHWYQANQVPTSFPAGGFTVGVAFDGSSIWAAIAGSDSFNVMKFRVSDGTLLGTFATAGISPQTWHLTVAMSGSRTALAIMSVKFEPATAHCSARSALGARQQA